MDCKHFESLLDGYLEGTLDESARLNAEEHLRTCPACRMRLKVAEDCRTLNEEDEVPVSFSEGYRERIMKEETIPVKKNFPKITRWLAVAAALVFVAGGTFLAGQNRRNSTPESAKIPEGSYAMEDTASVRGLGNVYAPAPANDYSFSAAEKQAAGDEQVEKIIRTVRVELSTRSFDGDYAMIRQALLTSGGRIQEANLYIGYGNLRTAYMTLRVPSEKLDSRKAGYPDRVGQGCWPPGFLQRNSGGCQRTVRRYVHAAEDPADQDGTASGPSGQGRKRGRPDCH